MPYSDLVGVRVNYKTLVDWLLLRLMIGYHILPIAEKRENANQSARLSPSFPSFCTVSNSHCSSSSMGSGSFSSSPEFPTENLRFSLPYSMMGGTMLELWNRHDHPVSRLKIRIENSNYVKILEGVPTIFYVCLCCK